MSGTDAGLFELCYESGRAVSMRIERLDEAPFAAAGLWRPWKEGNGQFGFSFTQLTINADHHTLMRRMHRPGEEKRNLVILPEHAWLDWLHAPTPDLASALLQPFDANAFHATAEASARHPDLFADSGC
ncbi:SOS response-associated peptidase family protein [Chitinibacteraceae bacterium HSL-7]